MNTKESDWINDQETLVRLKRQQNISSGQLWVQVFTAWESSTLKCLVLCEEAVEG